MSDNKAQDHASSKNKSSTGQNVNAVTSEEKWKSPRESTVSDIFKTPQETSEETFQSVESVELTNYESLISLSTEYKESQISETRKIKATDPQTAQTSTQKRQERKKFSPRAVDKKSFESFYSLSSTDGSKEKPTRYKRQEGKKPSASRHTKQRGYISDTYDEDSLNDFGQKIAEVEVLKNIQTMQNIDDKTSPNSLKSSGQSTFFIEKHYSNDELDERQKFDTTKLGLRYQASRFRTNLELGNAFIYVVIPPDGGYAWVILLISFLCQVIVDGIVLSIGGLLPAMKEDFDVNISTITFVASIQIGSISSAFINCFGFRAVALGGAIASIISIFIATFSSSLTQMIIFYSILGGPALSMIWVASQLIIGYYFEKYRPIANGIACSGAGAGLTIFSLMNTELVSKIGWRNTSRVHVAMLLLVLIMAIALIEVTPSKVGQFKEDEEDDEDDDESETDDEYDGENILYRFSRNVSPSGSKRSLLDRGLDKMLVEYDKPEPEVGVWRRCLDRCCPMWCKCFRRASATPDLTKRYLIRHDPIEKQDLFYTGPSEYQVGEGSVSEIDGKNVELMEDKKRNRTINYTLSMMQALRPSAEERSQTLKQLKKSHTYPFLAYISPKNWVSPKILQAFKVLFDFRLIREMEFQILLAAAFFFPMGFNIPFLYSSRRALIAEFYAALIAPTIGFSNFLFRIFSGYLGQRFKPYTTYICGWGIILGGVFVFGSAFFGEHLVWFQFTYAFCYGIAPAFYSTLRAIIYVQAVGLERLTNAFGLTALAMGSGVFVGTTLSGIMIEYTGNFDMSFIFAGSCLILAGSLKVGLPSLIKWRQNRASKKRKVGFEE